MSVTVSKVAAAFKDYLRANTNGKARFKLAVASPTKVIVSKKSFEFESNLTQILSDYAAGKNGQTIEAFKFEPGVVYKINGKRFRANYTEVVIKVSDMVAYGPNTKFAEFINSQSRECHDKNSRDKHVLEMVASMNSSGDPTTVEGRGEDA